MINFLMVLTLVGCFFVVKQAKRDVAQGQNVTRDNLKWHESMGNGKLGGRAVDDVIKNEREPK